MVNFEEPPNVNFDKQRERQEEYYEKIALKANFVAEVRDFIYEQAREMDSYEFEAAIKKKMKDIESEFSEETIAEAKEAGQLSKEINELKEEFNGLTEELLKREILLKEVNKEEEKREEKLKKEIEKKENRFSALISNDDLNFLFNVQRAGEAIIAKQKYVSQLKNKFEKSPEEFFKETKKFFGGLYAKLPENRLKIRFSPISVNILIPEDEFNHLFNKGNERKLEKKVGLHFKGTVFNFILDEKNSGEREKAIAHEDLHNFTDSFSKDNPDYYFSYLKDKFADLVAFKDQGKEKGLANERIRILKELIERKIKNAHLVLADSLQDELAANFASSVLAIKPDEYANLEDRSILADIFGKNAGIDNFVIATFDPEVRKTKTFLETIAENKQFPEIAELAKKEIKIIAKQAEGVRENFRDSFFLAKKLDEKTKSRTYTKELVGLSLLFAPHKYYRLRKVMERQMLEKDPVGLFDYYLKKPEKIGQLLKLNLPRKEFEKLDREISSNESKVYETAMQISLAISNPEQYKEYFNVLDELARKYNSRYIYSIRSALSEVMEPGH